MYRFRPIPRVLDDLDVSLFETTEDRKLKRNSAMVACLSFFLDTFQHAVTDKNFPHHVAGTTGRQCK